MSLSTNHQITIFAFIFLTFFALALNSSNLCSDTPYLDLCFSALSSSADVKDTNPKLISSVLQETLLQIKNSRDDFNKILQIPSGNNGNQAVRDCLVLVDQTMYRINTAITEIKPSKNVADVQSILSSAMANQQACINGFAETKSRTANNNDLMMNRLTNVTNHLRNALVLVEKLPGAIKRDVSLSESQKAFPLREDVYPEWMTDDDRKTIHEEQKEYNFVVSEEADGINGFGSINDAVNAAPSWSMTRFTIYIPAGVYNEQVEIPSHKTNIMFVGDGMGKTVLRGNRNTADGSSTFDSAVLGVVGDGFVAKFLTIENYAGPNKNQAVALRTSSDASAYFNCDIQGYQDTLYVVSGRQFYRDSKIYGTIDFIFGGATVVIQNCDIIVRNPLLGQQNVITAHSRTDPSQNTGISIMASNIMGAGDLPPSVQSYLGRPWEVCARVVVMKSSIGSLVDPAGWVEWDARTPTLPNLYFAEFANTGPGADTSRRVRWPGVKVIGEGEAGYFTAGALMRGGQWLPSTGIPHYLGLPN